MYILCSICIAIIIMFLTLTDDNMHSLQISFHLTVGVGLSSFEILYSIARQD